MLRVGIIGLGVGERHIAGFDLHPGCEVVALCDFDPKKLSEVSARYPEVQTTESAAQILSDPAIDIISIASFDNFHCEQVVTALDQGKHVFVEKPLCLSESEVLEIRGALKRNPKLKLSSNFPLRKVERFTWLKEKISAGELGALYLLEGDYNYGRFHKITEGWRGQIPFYSVNLGGGIHIVDLMLWLTGDEVVEVSAIGTALSSQGTAYRYNDTITSLLRLKSGAVAKVGSNYSCVYPHCHRLALYGSEATFTNGADGARMYKSRDPKLAPEQVEAAYSEGNKGALIYSFVESILGSGEPDVSTDDVFRSMSVCLAIERAMNEKSWVAVKYY